MAALTEALQDYQQDDEIEVAKKDCAGPIRDGRDCGRKKTGNEGRLEIAAFLIAQVKEQEKDHVEDNERYYLEPGYSESAIGEVIGNFAEPFVANPGMSSNRERIHVVTWKPMMLK